VVSNPSGVGQDSLARFLVFCPVRDELFFLPQGFSIHHQLACLDGQFHIEHWPNIEFLSKSFLWKTLSARAGALRARAAVLNEHGVGDLTYGPLLAPLSEKGLHCILVIHYGGLQWGGDLLISHLTTVVGFFMNAVEVVSNPSGVGQDTLARFLGFLCPVRDELFFLPQGFSIHHWLVCLDDQFHIEPNIEYLKIACHGVSNSLIS